jgi:Pin2-interacting protein X1
MGLAAPKKRNKIAHDPNNLSWSSNAAANSFGHRIMVSQGWSEGEALGSKASKHHAGLGSKSENAARLAAAKVKTIYKDDTLGLGAKYRSKDSEAQRAGMDAFMGLLGRLNAKNAQEEEAVEKKEEDRKLHGYASSKWGRMTFVPGGVLVGDKQFGTKKAALEGLKTSETPVDAAAEDAESTEETGSDEARAKRKAERRKRKEERRARKEARAIRRAKKAARKSGSQPQSAKSSQPTSQTTSDDEEGSERPAGISKRRARSRREEKPSGATSDVSGTSDDQTETVASKVKKRKRKEESSAPPVLAVLPSPAPRPTVVRNARHILRGRNIAAKTNAFQAGKHLDGIFLKAAAV